MVKILSDSTCDLSAELLERYQVDILPLHIVLGSEQYEDGRGISPEEIYRWSDENRQTPKTAACSVDEAMEAFEPYTLGGDGAVCFAISQSMSSSANNMRVAAQKLEAEDRILVVDSENLSSGIGLLVIEAAIMAQEGLSAAEIATRIEALKPRVRASFVVDTLTYLHRGGRCSGISAFVGSTLKLHPKIVVQNGRMLPGKKYRGRMTHAVCDYVDDMMEDLKRAKADRVFLTHSGCDAALLDTVREKLQSLNRFREIHIERAGGVISSHCGPGTLGVLFIEGEE